MIKKYLVAITFLMSFSTGYAQNIMGHWSLEEFVTGEDTLSCAMEQRIMMYKTLKTLLGENEALSSSDTAKIDRYFEIAMPHIVEIQKDKIIPQKKVSSVTLEYEFKDDQIIMVPERRSMEAYGFSAPYNLTDSTLFIDATIFDTIPFRYVLKKYQPKSPEPLYGKWVLDMDMTEKFTRGYYDSVLIFPPGNGIVPTFDEHMKGFEEMKGNTLYLEIGKEKSSMRVSKEPQDANLLLFGNYMLWVFDTGIEMRMYYKLEGDFIMSYLTYGDGLLVNVMPMVFKKE